MHAFGKDDASFKEALDRATAERGPSLSVSKLSNLERFATIPAARTRLLEILKQLGIRIGLDFYDAKSGKRGVRKVRSGIISIGGYQLPVAIHGRDNCDPNRPEGDCGCSAVPKIATTDRIGTPDDGDAKSGENMAQVTWEGDSLNMVNRGDRIRTCDLLVPNQSRYQAALRPD